MKKTERKHQLSRSEVIEAIPPACSDELAAVELLEGMRWGNSPACVHCGSANVYKMTDAKTGERNKRFLWRCRNCKQQYTVRIGTVYEESRIELRHWCYAFWRAATSKKGVSALEIKRHCQLSYKSALFLMNRIRFAMAPDLPEPRLGTPEGHETVECDETYVGGKPRWHGPERKKRKQAVFAAVERNGRIHRKVIPNVTAETLKGEIRKLVDPRARIITDDFGSYHGIGGEFEGGHRIIRHSERQYAYWDINTNTVESSFALLKRSIMGIYHNVSREYLHRYVWQADFLWNGRKMNDGERTALAIRAAEGKRLMYKQPTAN